MERFKNFIRENYYLIFLWIICGIALFFSVGHCNNIILDVGREVYYPEQILKGEVLYKDLFVIYGPFAYLFNAILYKILGAKLSTLYFSGICSSFLAISGIYFLAKEFLSKSLSFSICLLTIFTSVYSAVFFNFSFPYSWAMLYGTIAYVFALLSLIKFEKTNNKNLLYLTSFLLGICISCKYEFAIPILLYIVYLFIKLKTDKILLLKNIGFLSTIPLLSFGTLFIQGLTIKDLLISLYNVKNMSQCQTLKYFYETVGAYFNPKIIPILITTFLKTGISVGLLCLGKFLKEKNKIASVITYIIGTIVSIWCLTDTKILTIAFLPILLTICGIVSFKHIKTNIPLLILIIGSVAVSLKSFWGMVLLGYASFYFFFTIIGILVLLLKFKGKTYQNSITFYFILFSLCLFFINYLNFTEQKCKIQSEIGTIYTTNDVGEATNELISFIEQKTNKNDKIVIFPEGLLVNFLTDRKSDGYYNSMLPLYIESFGEDNIIKYFEQNKPEYFVLSNQNMSDYGFNFICNDYAFGLCEFISKNYNQIKIIDYDYRYLIYKKK